MSRNGTPPDIPELEIAGHIAERLRPGTPGGAQPSCEACDFMRREGNAMRCYYEPPTPMLIATVPSKIAGGPPQLVIAGLSPEVHAARFCRHHPMLEGRALGPLGAAPMSPGYGAESPN
jgi:hypothetical protein